MSDFDWLKLDGNTLRQFLAVYDAQSVTKAAKRLGVGQSAVSHGLDRLRGVFSDPLFVRQGRGIVPTDQAHVLAQRVRTVLPLLEDLGTAAGFSPADLTGQVTIAADDFERELFGPSLFARLQKDAPGLDLRFLSPGTENAGYLRSGRCDLLMTPSPPDGTEFVQRKLFSDPWRMFFDPETPPPDTLAGFVSRPHAKVVFSDDETTYLDDRLAAQGVQRRVALRVNSFLALPALMRGTDLVVTLPEKAGQTFMQGFASCAVPVALAPLQFNLLWHDSQRQSAKSVWLRELVLDVVRDHVASQ